MLAELWSGVDPLGEIQSPMQVEKGGITEPAVYAIKAPFAGQGSEAEEVAVLAAQLRSTRLYERQEKNHGRW